MSKPPKIVIPGLNRGAGVPPGFILGRLPGTGHGPAQLLNLTSLRRVGLATASGVTTSTSVAISTATSLVASLSVIVSGSVSTVTSQVTSLSTAVSTVVSGSISGVNSRVDSLSTAVGGGAGTSTSLSQISSSLSGAISSTTSLSSAVSTVISGSISTVVSMVNSLSTAGGGGGSGTGYEGGPVTPPTTADLATWDNQGTSTATDGTGAMILKVQVDGVHHGRYKTAPATPYDIYCRVEHNVLTTTLDGTVYGGGAGIIFKDTATSNKRVLFGIYQTHNVTAGDDAKFYAAMIQRWSGASPPVFDSTPTIKYGYTPWKWLWVNNNGTTLTFKVSMDGKNWVQIGTETIATFIGGTASYGVGANSTASSTEAFASFAYFGTTAPA